MTARKTKMYGKGREKRLRKKKKMLKWKKRNNEKEECREKN